MHCWWFAALKIDRRANKIQRFRIEINAKGLGEGALDR